MLFPQPPTPKLQRSAQALVLGLLLSSSPAVAAHAVRRPVTPLLAEVERRACLFFWQQSDPNTGLTKDRAHNGGAPDNYTVASIASTGYALASLPIAVQNGWRTRQEAYDRALTTLRFLYNQEPQVRGWFYHFLDMHTGARVWKCELSSIDTVLLMEGALMAGQYFHGTAVDRLAHELFNRLDWHWMLTNGGTEPDKRVVSMGWHPESGFIKSNWDSYDELTQLYLLGMGARNHPLPVACWSGWKRPVITYDGIQTLAGGPIFLFEMSPCWIDLRQKRDALGWDYWDVGRNGVLIDQKFCANLAGKRKTYAEGFWALNASDGPDGYTAYGAPDHEDGTVSPTGAIAAVLFTPRAAGEMAQRMHDRLGARAWGTYGFPDAFNLDRNWFDPDVLGIDLGMAMLAIEDVRTGLPWRLLEAEGTIPRGMRAAGFHRDPAAEPQPIRRS